MDFETRLLMTFETALGKKVSLFVSNPREDLTEQEIKTAMETIVAKDIFSFGGENALVSALNAKLVETKTTEYDLIIS